MRGIMQGDKSDMNTNEKKLNTKAEEKKYIIRNLVFTVLVIAFFVSIISVYHINLYKEKRESIIRKGEATAKDAADQVEKYLSTNINSVNLAAYALDEMIGENKSDKDIREYLVAQSSAIKNAVYENSTGLYAYINGRFFSGTNWTPPDDYDATDRPWYKRPFDTPGEITILDPYLDIQSGNYMLALGKTLRDGKSVVSIDVSLDRIQKLIENAVLSEESDHEMILNDKGEVVAHSDREEIGRNYHNESGTMGDQIVRRLNRESEDFEFSLDGQDYIAYVADIRNGWVCISVENVTSVFASLNRMLIATVAIQIAIVIIISFIMTRSMKFRSITLKTQAESDAKSAFLANVSHEIRTPINTILGMNEMILRESSDPGILDHSEKIKAAGGILTSIVNDMIDHSHFEVGRANAGAYEYVRVESEKGNTVTQSEATAKSSKNHYFTAEDACILAVDDNPMNLMVFKALTKTAGMTVDTAENGEEAVERCREKKYDILFIDHMMPVKDGIEALKEIRADRDRPNADTPAVCLTANVQEGAREQYIKAGFDEYMGKPIDVEILEEVLLRYIPVDKIKMHKKDEDEGEDAVVTEIPENLKAIDGDLIEVEKGLKNSGKAEIYLSLLKVFYESVDENAEAICRYYEDEDYKNYTIRVHALKSSARIIGALAFGEEAQQLENAGKAEDMEYIRSHHDEFMDKYRGYKELLEGLFEEEEADQDKPEADAALMEDVFAELLDAAGEMDCDRLDAVFDEMKGYKIPDGDSKLFSELQAASERFEYDEIIRLLNGR